MEAWNTLLCGNYEMSDAEGDSGGGDGDSVIVWFLYVGQESSAIPRDVTHVRIDASVKVICRYAFRDCHQLVEVVLSEGLEYIEGGAFSDCISLQRMKFPSTIKGIGAYAFYDCFQLMEAELSEGLEKIEKYAFCGCKSLPRIKIPSTVKEVNEGAFNGCIQLMGVDFSDGVVKINKSAFGHCSSLRNLAIAGEAQIPQFFSLVVPQSFEGCHDLMRLFGMKRQIIDALKSRFDGLPVHKLCYYQSCYPAEVVTQKLEEIMGVRGESTSLPSMTIEAQDCLGMTPLHVLACSATQNLDLYQIITAKYPNSLITDDKWGCIPLLYAIWGNASHEIVQFLIDSTKSAFPNIISDWDEMIETLCRVGAPLETVQRLLDIHQTSFLNQSVNWYKAGRELTICCLVRCCTSFEGFSADWVATLEAFNASHANPELIQSLQTLQQGCLSDLKNVNWKLVCEEFVEPLKGRWRRGSRLHSLYTFRFLVKCSIPERLHMIGVRKWRTEIQKSVGSLSSVGYSGLPTHCDLIHYKLLSYENEYCQLKDATFLLELALWKSKIDQTLQTGEQLAADMKEECRINSGADVIIPNVLPFLIGR